MIKTIESKRKWPRMDQEVKGGRKRMNRIKRTARWHHYSMKLCNRANYHAAQKNRYRMRWYYLFAYLCCLRAVHFVKFVTDFEPPKSTVYSCAARLALICGFYVSAERLAMEGANVCAEVTMAAELMELADRALEGLSANAGG